MSKDLIELIGYAGSVLVAVSLTMSAIVKLRIINLAGALLFAIYGFIIGALPVGFLNSFIALADAYYLYKMFSAKEMFDILQVPVDSDYLRYFINFHLADIQKFMPSFNFNPGSGWQAFFILRNSVPAGLVCSERADEDSILIKLDYAIPGYRDFKMGKYVFPKLFSETRVKEIISPGGNKEHIKYLEKMGFTRHPVSSDENYVLTKK